jgi:phosphopantetheine adenylyltransferase
MKTNKEFIQELFEKVRNLEEALKYLEDKTESDINRIEDTVGSLDRSNDWTR